MASSEIWTHYNYSNILFIALLNRVEKGIPMEIVASFFALSSFVRIPVPINVTQFEIVYKTLRENGYTSDTQLMQDVCIF